MLISVHPNTFKVIVGNAVNNYRKSKAKGRGSERVAAALCELNREIQKSSLSAREKKILTNQIINVLGIADGK